MSSAKSKLLVSNKLDAWVIAKQTFLQDASEEDRDLLKKSPQLTQQKLAEEIEVLKAEKTGRIRACLVKLQPYFDGISNFDAILSPLFSMVPYGIGDVLWGSVKVCLSLIKKHVETFETISSFLCDVGKKLERLGLHEELYEKLSGSRYADALANVYTQYLAFFRHARSYFEASRFRRFRESVGLTKHPMSALVTLSIDLVNGACKNAMEEANLSEKQARAQADKQQADDTNQIIQEVEKVGVKVDQAGAEAETRRREILFQEYLDWLKHIDMEKKRKELLPPKQADIQDDSGAWIFADDVFRTWLTSSSNSGRLLWLNGDPGFGKTALTATIVDEMLHWKSTGLAYFFCRYQDGETRTIGAILRSWIWQLLRPPHIGGQVFAGHCSLPQEEYNFTKSEDPSCEIMCGVMRQLYSQNRPTMLIIDGLDECREPLENTAEREDWEDFFKLLRDIPQEWKVLVVSRPRTVFRDLFLTTIGDKLIEREIKSKDNRAAIRNFVEEKLQQISAKNSWKPETTQKAYDVLTNNADGMFMWVNLYCKELEYKNSKAADAALQHPPKGLSGFYDRTMESLNLLNPDLAASLRNALMWVLCAPRAFKVPELQEGLESPEMGDKLVRMLGSFIRIDPESNGILIVHASAREYLLSPEANLVKLDRIASDQLQLIPFHTEILTRCLEYLSDEEEDFVDVDSNQKASEQRFREKLREKPFLEYSCINWVYHLNEIAKKPDSLQEIKEALNTFLLSEDNVLRWLQMFHFLFQFNYPGSTSSRRLIGHLTYHLKKDGNRAWEAFFLQNYPAFVKHLSWSDGNRFTRWDRYMHVRKEFNGYDEPGRWFQSPTCFPAVSVAAFFNYSRALESMIDDYDDLKDYKGPLNGTPLLWAATADSCATLEFLLGAGADKNVGYANTGERPIIRAIRMPRAVNRRAGTLPAALMLARHGAQLKFLPDDQGWIERTALITLIEEEFDSPGAAELARELLKTDEARYRDYVRRGTVLQTAAWLGKPTIIAALLEDSHVRRRINVQQRGMAALHNACQSNNPAVVKSLTDAGADVDLRCNLNGFTPLHFAIRSGGRTVPAMLIAGANPHIVTLSGDSAIHLASKYNVDVDLKLFIDKGVDINQPNSQGHTALLVALENHNFQMATKLLDAGADQEKIPSGLLREQPPHQLDPRLLPIRHKNWQPRKSFELAWILKQRASQLGHSFPIPLIARVLRYLKSYETIEAHYKGHSTVDEAFTLRGGEQQPYVKTPPIFGAATKPVHKIVLTVFGRCQNFGPEYSYSFFEAKTMERGSNRCLKWEPEFIFGHGAYELARKDSVLTEDREKNRKHLHRLRYGDAVAIIQRAHYPGFQNIAEWATIQLEVSILRDTFKDLEKEEIWKHNREGKGKRRRCVVGRCPACAIKLPKEWPVSQLIPADRADRL